MIKCSELMKFREIAQHNRASFFIIIILLILDVLAFYTLYNFSFNIHIPQIQLLLLASFLFMGYLSKGYNPSPLTSRKREIKSFVKIYILSVGFYIVFQYILEKVPIEKLIELSFFWVRLLIFTLIIRLVVRWVQKLFLNANIGLRDVIILGKGESSLNLINQLKKTPSLGYNVLGYVSDDNDLNMDKSTIYLGRLSDIQEIISNNDIDDIIISSSEYSHDEILNIIGSLYNLSVCIKIVPDMYEALTGQVKMSILHGLALIDINPDILTEYQRLVKRLLDVLISIITLVCAMPILIMVIFIIKLTSSGSIFYTQVRVGRKGRHFNLYKFRTMFENSEQESGPVWASVDDPRITPIGRFLRKFRIDEIPQLFNVLKGDMSIVGPRPERPFFVEKLTARFPYYSRRLCLRPGITGWAQVIGDYDTTVENVENKLKHDFYYIENISMLLDLKIMLMTLIILGKGRGR
jgi:exopolysaccharide biosynthesis polyprenyl glycosylphosphotransferase